MNEVTNVDFTRQPQEQGKVQVPRTSQTEMMVARQAQEVQVAMLAAKKFPRDQVVAFNNIIRACQRMKLAESSMYEYPRGGEKITGPSIRLAEAIAQNWGNIDFGFMELEQRNGVSQVMAYAWDLETNARQTKMFSVPHIRHTRRGDYPLTDPRDIYEMVANQAARRVRACILGIVPGDVVEAAVLPVQQMPGSHVTLVRHVFLYDLKISALLPGQIGNAVGDPGGDADKIVRHNMFL